MTEFDLQQFNTQQNYAITASAGTGKTYSIVEIVKKLLDSGVYQLSDLLLVTYTEKAAGELKNRIRQRVGNVDVDSAVIGTIHSFCQKTIREFCVTAGKPSGLTLIDETDCAAYVDRFVRNGEVFEIIRTITENSDEHALGLGDSLAKELKAIIPRYYLNDSGREEPKVAATMSQAYRTAAVEGVANARKQYPIIDDWIRTIANSGIQKLQKLAKDLEKSLDLNFRKPNHIDDDLVSAPEDVCAAYHNLERVRDIFKKVPVSPIENIVIKSDPARQNAVETLTYWYLGEAYLGWQAEKAKRSEQTYNDMIRTVREEIVRGGALLEKLRGKYKYAIIDEFQDTNQLQWDIFKRVFLTEDHHLTVVGDPKQSIYAFQGADVTVFDEALREIEDAGGTVCALSKNYRSTREMVEEGTAKFFAGLWGDYFTPSECGEQNFKAFYNGEPVKPYWICGEPGDGPSPKAYADSVCEMIVDCCTKGKDERTRLRVNDKQPDGTFAERNVSFRDFVLLARKRGEMEAFEKALGNCGIPFVRYKDKSLFISRECAHWIAVLEAIDTPDFSGRRREVFLKALFTVFFLNSIDAAGDPKYKKDSGREIALFEKWRHAAADRRWEDLIDGILLDSYVEQNLGGLNALKSLGVVRQLGSYCLEYLSKGHSLTQLIKTLKRKNGAGDTDDGDEADGNLIAKSTDYDAVRIMTIHAAKGLQFPVVIFCGMVTDNQNIRPYTYHDCGKRVISFKKDQIVIKEETEEIQRLIYVAFTRAKFLLMLPTNNRIKKKEHNCIKYDYLANAIAGYMGRGGPYHSVEIVTEPDYPALKERVEKILGKAAEPDAEAANAQLARIGQLIDGKKARNTYKFSYSNLSHMHVPNVPVTAEDGAQPDNSEDENTEEDTGLGKYDPNGMQILCRYDEAQGPIELSEKFPVGPKLGNALHTVFELADYRQGAFSDDFAALAERCFKNEGFRVRAEWLEDTKEIARNVLAAELPSIRGSAESGAPFCLSELDFADRKNEAEFNFNKENEFLKRFFNGFIDLIFRRGEYYSILDWKSDRLREDFTSYADGAELKKHVDELYAIQRVLYSYCLIKWLKNFYPDLTEQEIFERHYGGIYYVFLRGCRAGTGNGVYAQTWACYGDLETAYRNIVKERVEKNEELPESV